MDTINLIAWILIGGLIGLIATVFWVRTTFSPGGALLNVIVGAIGGVAGGYILNQLQFLTTGDISGVNIGAALIAIVGALVMLFLLSLVRNVPR